MNYEKLELWTMNKGILRTMNYELLKKTDGLFLTTMYS